MGDLMALLPDVLGSWMGLSERPSLAKLLSKMLCGTTSPVRKGPQPLRSCRAHVLTLTFRETVYSLCWEWRPQQLLGKIKGEEAKWDPWIQEAGLGNP